MCVRMLGQVCCISHEAMVPNEGYSKAAKDGTPQAQAEALW